MVGGVEQARAQALLTKAKLEAEAELARLRGEPVAPDDGQTDPSTDADGLVEFETDEAVEEVLTQRLEAIERAEARLRDGSYGRSALSGEPIPDGRLEIEPWAELTVEEQAAS
jgi:DnaK suppressor protein